MGEIPVTDPRLAFGAYSEGSPKHLAYRHSTCELFLGVLEVALLDFDVAMVQKKDFDSQDAGQN